ncbi:hypothetical protein VNO78_21484 [Psophocarpus tetragonolobus]|uniref:HTH myb-type domain-containing protein n=1 Tax=Psophocarpus tetragonolobus TaxID=3891 RepID=A0AAN9SFD8_PSOTE
MREEEANWFSRWEEDLPSPEELMPLSQTLISHDLAMAFDITNLGSHQHHHRLHHCNREQQQCSEQGQEQHHQQFTHQTEEEPARTLKRPRLVWTPQLHKRFVDAVAHLGIKNAVPKTIMQLMSVDGLTRENVASHLQKYRLYLKRMQGLSAGGGCAGAGSADPATDRLFASSPVPAHFLHPAIARPSAEHYLSYVPVPGAVQQQQQRSQHQHLAVAASHRHYGSPRDGHFELPILSRMGAPMPGFAAREDVESGGRRVLTLFPAGDINVINVAMIVVADSSKFADSSQLLYIRKSVDTMKKLQINVAIIVVADASKIGCNSCVLSIEEFYISIGRNKFAIYEPEDSVKCAVINCNSSVLSIERFYTSIGRNKLAIHEPEDSIKCAVLVRCQRKHIRLVHWL